MFIHRLTRSNALARGNSPVLRRDNSLVLRKHVESGAGIALDASGEKMLLLIALPVLLVISLACVPAWPYNERWNYYPCSSSGLLALLVTFLVNWGYL